MISSFLLLVLAVVVGAGPPSAVVVVDAVAVMVAPCRPGAGSACAQQEVAPGAPACRKQGADPLSRLQLLTRSQVRSQSGGDEVWTVSSYPGAAAWRCSAAAAPSSPPAALAPPSSGGRAGAGTPGTPPSASSSPPGLSS